MNNGFSYEKWSQENAEILDQMAKIKDIEAPEYKALYSRLAGREKIRYAIEREVKREYGKLKLKGTFNDMDEYTVTDSDGEVLLWYYMDVETGEIAGDVSELLEEMLEEL